MKLNKIELTIILLLPVLMAGCGKKYARKEGCHLDRLSIKGDVVKVETIVQSSIPLTELLSYSFDPYYELSMFQGNLTLEFDNDGNVKHSVGYGMNGEILYDVKGHASNKETMMSPALVIGPDINQDIDKIKSVTSESKQKKVLENKYYNDDKLLWTQRAFYNDEGLPMTIVKDYDLLRIKTDHIDITYSDTTTFKYRLPDEHGNWTEAEVDYKGVLPKHCHSYIIKRQITYSTDKEKPSLVNQLQNFNVITPISTDSIDKISLGNYGSIKIPHYMALQSKKYIDMIKGTMPSIAKAESNYIFMSIYDKNDAYASLSVSLSPYGSEGYDDYSPQDLVYDQKTDEILERQFTRSMEAGGTYVLKWLPYSFVNISGHNALRLRYYRYGKGSPIPVYCETHVIHMSDGNAISFTYSFQSNLDYKFHTDFDNAVKSITLNQ